MSSTPSTQVDKRAAVAGTPGFLQQQRSRHGEKLVVVLLLLAALVSVATTLGIVISLFVPAAEFFTEVPITEFTVAPQLSPPEGGLPYHEWLVEFEHLPSDLADFTRRLNEAMVAQNIYYQDLIAGGILRPLIVRPLPKDAFREYMKTQGKLGGQNKVPRLSNDRKIADFFQV